MARPRLTNGSKKERVVLYLTGDHLEALRLNASIAGKKLEPYLVDLITERVTTPVFTARPISPKAVSEAIATIRQSAKPGIIVPERSAHHPRCPCLICNPPKDKKK